MIDNDDLDLNLEWHLRFNFYPAMSTSLIPVCKEAINAVNSQEPNKVIMLPEGITKGPDNAVSVSANEVIEDFELYDFVNY